MSQVFIDNFSSQLATSVSSGATSLQVTPGDGAKLPTLNVALDEFLILTLIQGATVEKIRVNTIVGDTLSVQRAQEDTIVAQPFTTGAIVSGQITAGALAEFVKKSDNRPYERSQTVIATEGQIEFSLDYDYYPGQDSINVFLQGTSQDKSTYDEVHSKLIRLKTGAKAGEEYRFQYKSGTFSRFTTTTGITHFADDQTSIRLVDYLRSLENRIRILEGS